MGLTDEAIYAKAAYLGTFHAIKRLRRTFYALYLTARKELPWFIRRFI